MKHGFILAVMGIFILTLTSSIVCAQPVRDIGIQERIAAQQSRIDQGIVSGRLTQREAAIIQDNLNWIRDRELRMKADGILTGRERERLHRMLDQNSEMIFRKKHNRIRRLY